MRRSRDHDSIEPVGLWGAALVAIGLVASAARAADAPICPDRPGKATPACTVPAGKFQIESSLIDWTHDHSDGTTTDSYSVAATAIKYGVTDRWTIEADIAPHSDVRTDEAGVHNSVSGFGDIFLRTKYRLTADDNARLQAAIYPFMKLPTAGSLGNGKLEGGIAVPIQYAVPNSALGLDLAPEVDAAANNSGSGYHPALVGAVSLGAPLTSKLSISGELWGAFDFDPARTTRQYTLDGSLAWLASSNVQLDGGANFGLNRNTPDLELYTGISVRF